MSSCTAKTSSSCPVVGLRPEMEAVRRLHELRRDAHVVARLAHAPLEQRRHVELLADDAQVLVLALELERRRAARDPQLRDLGQGVEQLLGEAVGEVLLVLAGAHVHEGQHGDRGDAPVAAATPRTGPGRLPARARRRAASASASARRRDGRPEPPPRAAAAAAQAPARRRGAPLRRVPPQALQVRPHLRGALVAQRAVLLHRLGDDPLQLRGQLARSAAPAPPAPRLKIASRTSPVLSPRERQHSRRHLVQHRPEGVQVRARVQLLSRAPAPATCRPPSPSSPRCGSAPSGRLAVGLTESDASLRQAAWPGRSPGASPAPARVTKMFAGLMSRWTMPLAWAASSASAICVPSSSTRPSASACRRSGASASRPPSAPSR